MHQVLSIWSSTMLGRHTTLFHADMGQQLFPIEKYLLQYVYIQTNEKDVSDMNIYCIIANVGIFDPGRGVPKSSPVRIRAPAMHH